MRSTYLRSKCLLAVFFVFLFMILFIKIKTFFNFYDEGFAIFGATRVLNGDVPYKDFWSIYPPGQFYLIATVIRIFGPNLLTARVYDTLIRFLMMIGVYLLARRVTYRWIALLVTVITAFMLASAGFYSYAVFPAMTFGIWSMVCWLTYTDQKRKRWLVLAGLLLGMAIFIRWDIGVYAGISLLAGAYLFLLTTNRKTTYIPDSDVQPSDRLRKGRLVPLLAPLNTLAWLLVPMTAVALLSYTWIGLLSGWKNIYEQVFYFPTSLFHSVRWLSYPSLIPPDLIQIKTYFEYPYPVINPPSEDWFRFYLPILTLAIAFIYLVVTYIRSRSRPDQKYFTVITLTIFGALLFNQALSRYDLIHVTPSSILTIMVAGSVFSYASLVALRNWIKQFFLALLIILTLVYFAPSLKDLLNSLDAAAPWGCYSTIKKLGCVTVMPDEEQAAQYIASITQPSDKIYVGNQKHDRIFVNDVGFYYLAGRPSGTRYHELHPGVANTLQVQTEIAKELEQNQVKWAVLVKIWDSNEPNDSALSSGVTFLDEYLHTHFTNEAEFGNYQIWVRTQK